MAGLWLATAAVAAPPPILWEPTDQIQVEAHDDTLALTWADTEERLQGSILPAVPRAGQPLKISLQVGSFEGAPFEGPLILTLREAGATHGQSLTVKKDAQHWQATFTPEREGPHLLDVSFRTTRHKALHAALQVKPSQVPQLLGWAVLGLGGLVLLGYTVRGLLRGERPEERALPSTPEEPVLPMDTTSAPASGTAPAAQSTPPGLDAPAGSEPPATPVDTEAQPPDSAPTTSEGEPPSQ